MYGLGWTFDQLVSYLLPESHMNPIIKQLLTTIPGSSVVGIGGHSVVLQISPDIAAKVSMEPDDERLRHEQAVFAQLEESDCPHLVQCYHSAPGVSFLQLVANGTLHDRLGVAGERPVLRWMLQTAQAAACLETIGYAHGDINPHNILIDDDDQAKLADLDHALKVGEDVDVGYEPYVRQNRVPNFGLFGEAGPVTEQFALGSVFWYMTRGCPLYAELERPDHVHRLIDGVFPPTDPQDPIDCIIRSCWHAEYPTMAHLVEAIKLIPGADVPTGPRVTPGQRQERRQLCEEYCRVANLTVIQSNAKEEEDARFDTASARNNTEKCLEFADISHATPIVAGKSSMPTGYQSNQRRLPMKTSMLRFRTRAKSMCNFL